jgi:hypothetical protein
MTEYLTIEQPTPPARKFGLFSVAEVVNASDHELMGIQYVSDNCDFAVTATSDAVCVGTPVARTATSTERGLVQAVGFPVYAMVECKGVNEFGRAQQRAISIMNSGVERAIELQVGALLAAAADDITPGTTPPAKTGVAVIEDALDSGYRGVGTMLTSRFGLSILSSLGFVVGPKGQHLESSLGTPVGGGHNIAIGPGGDVPAANAEAWLYGVGQITVRLGKQFASEPVFVGAADTNEVQSLTITGSPTGGTYTLTFDGQTTAAIAYNANAAAIQSALLALSNIDAGDVTVTGTGPFTITFGGQYAGDPVSQITATSSLTGGTAPAVTTGTTTQGSDNFGTNLYRVMVQRLVVVDWDCIAVATKFTV